MRIKSKVITIEYAGATLLKPGSHLNGKEYGGSRAYSTAAVDVVDAAHPEIRSYGNASGSMSFAVCVDCETEDEAVAEAMPRITHLDAHQTGSFTFSVGDTVQKWHAGITSADWSISYTVDAVRLTFSYSFTLGEPLSANYG